MYESVGGLITRRRRPGWVEAFAPVSPPWLLFSPVKYTLELIVLALPTRSDIMGIDPRLIANMITENPDVPAIPDTTKTKLKAFPFDADNPLGGDHAFYAPGDAVDFTEGDTFEALVERVKKNHDPLEITIEGFWVVTEQDCRLADAVWPMDGPGNDSAIYRYNNAAKRLLRQAALGIVNRDGYRRY